MIILQAVDPMNFNLIFLGAFMVIMYLFFIRPQVRKQKSQDEFVKNMAKGDEVVTTSGIIGKISKIESRSVQLQLDQKTFINVVPGAISKEMSESYAKPIEDKK